MWIKSQDGKRAVGEAKAVLDDLLDALAEGRDVYGMPEEGELE